MCNFWIRSGKVKGAKSFLSLFQTRLNAYLGNMLIYGTTCQKKTRKFFWVKNLGFGDRKESNILCLEDHIKFNFSLYSTGLFTSDFDESLSPAGKWQIGGFHSPVPSLQSFFYRETWDFAILPLQIRQKHHCSNYSDLKSSRSHFFLGFC